MLALDLIRDHLAVTNRGALTAIESKLNAVALWFRGSNCRPWAPNKIAASGIWAVYQGDSAQIQTDKNAYRAESLALLSTDGIFKGGPGYGHARFAGSRLTKSYFMDVLEFTGHDRYYDNPQFRGLNEWLFRGTFTPARKLLSFGDTESVRPLVAGGYAAPYRAHRFSNRAARNAAWVAAGKKPLGVLINYVLMDQPLPSPEPPASGIWPDGMASFWESPAVDSVMGALWNPKRGGAHGHRDVNAVHLYGYGENLLRNSGYCGWGLGFGGFDFNYYSSSAISSNTVLINETNHVGGSGGGIVEGFTAPDFDYASGHSGNALPNGTHTRSLSMVHAQDGSNGYFVLIDDVHATSASARVNIPLHGNAAAVTTVAGNTEYQWAVNESSGSNTFLSAFLATPPASVAIRDGGFCAFNNASFVGKYVFSSYNTDSANSKSVVTVLFPHNTAHPKAAMTRIAGTGFTGARIEHRNSAADYAIESDGKSAVTLDAMSILGRAAVIRRDSSSNVAFYFVRAGRRFDAGQMPRIGFESAGAVSFYLKGTRGRIVSPGTNVTLHHPGISGVLLGGNSQGILHSGAGWIEVAVPAGTHELELRTGGSLQLSATASANVTTGSPPLAVRLTATASGGTPPYQFSWNFGDGSASASQSVEHTYAAAGSFNATVTVTDAVGGIGSASVLVTVLLPAKTVFSAVRYLGDSLNYAPKTQARWEVASVDDDDRYFLNTTAYASDGDRLGEYALIRGWTVGDFAMKLKAKTAEDLTMNLDADYAIVFGWQNPDDYYYLMANSNAAYSVLFVVKNGTRTAIASAGAALIPDNLWHEIEVMRASSRITIRMDGREVITVTSTVFVSGGLGVGAYNDSVYFDDIDVALAASSDGGIADATEIAQDAAEANTPDAGTAAADAGVANAPDANAPDGDTPDAAAPGDGATSSVGQEDATSRAEGMLEEPGNDPPSSSGCACSARTSASKPEHGLTLLVGCLWICRRRRRLGDHPQPQPGPQDRR